MSPAPSVVYVLQMMKLKLEILGGVVPLSLGPPGVADSQVNLLFSALGDNTYCVIQAENGCLSVSRAAGCHC